MEKLRKGVNLTTAYTELLRVTCNKDSNLTAQLVTVALDNSKSKNS